MRGFIFGALALLFAVACSSDHLVTNAVVTTDVDAVQNDVQVVEGDVAQGATEEVSADAEAPTSVRNPLTCVGAEEGTPCIDVAHCILHGTCQSGQCVVVVNPCEDGNICTDDSCDAETGCVHLFNTATCTDNNVCTGNDHCVDGGTCMSDWNVVCDDNNFCTLDYCHAIDGCQHEIEESACDDKNPCSIDSCTPSGCTHVADWGKPCNDGYVCTQKDVCTGYGPSTGKCEGFDPISCDDGNECTSDTCIGLVGCKHTMAADGDKVSCSDGSACTLIDTCVGGSCVPGKSFECSDNNQCTIDSCDPTKGCVHTAINPETDCPGAWYSEKSCSPTEGCKSHLPELYAADMVTDPNEKDEEYPLAVIQFLYKDETTSGGGKWLQLYANGGPIMMSMFNPYVVINQVCQAYLAVDDGVETEPVLFTTLGCVVPIEDNGKVVSNCPTNFGGKDMVAWIQYAAWDGPKKIPLKLEPAPPAYAPAYISPDLEAYCLKKLAKKP